MPAPHGARFARPARHSRPPMQAICAVITPPAASCCVVPCCAAKSLCAGLAGLPASRIVARVTSRHQGELIAAPTTPRPLAWPVPHPCRRAAALEILNAVVSRLRKRAALDEPPLLAPRLARRPEEQRGCWQAPLRGPAAPAAAMKRLKSDAGGSGTVSHRRQGGDEQRDTSRALQAVAGERLLPGARLPRPARPQTSCTTD